MTCQLRDRSGRLQFVVLLDVPQPVGFVRWRDRRRTADSANGAGGCALNYAAKTVTAIRTELGLRGDKSWAMAEGLLTQRGRAAWAHDYNSDRNVAAVFQSLPGSTFIVNGARAARNAARYEW